MDLEVVENDWTIEEDFFLFENWQDLTVTQLANRLLKNKENVRERIKFYKLRNDNVSDRNMYFKNKLLKIHGKTLPNIQIANRIFTRTFLSEIIREKLRRDNFTRTEAVNLYKVAPHTLKSWLDIGLAPTSKNIKKIKEQFCISDSEFEELSKIVNKKSN